jgi:hypothetical protein
MAGYVVTIEAPPYHACTVRTLTPKGFPDMAPYRAFADRYTASRGGFTAGAPLDRTIGDVHSVLEWEFAPTADGKLIEALITSVDGPSDAMRARGQTATEIRFVRQFRSPSTPP